MTRLVAGFVSVVAIGLGFCLACAGKGDDDAKADAGAGGQGGAGGTSASGGAGTAGSAAGGGAGKGQGGAGSGGASAGTGQGGMSAAAGNSGAGLNDVCAFTDLTSSYSAIADDFCVSGYCLWDGRAIGETYCTIPCSGPDATCPMSYVCVEDQVDAGKYWCGRPVRVVPPDVGTVECTGNFDCINGRPDSNAFCIGFNNSACTDGLCLQDPIAKSNYCTTKCYDPRSPCPDGYDCIHDPSTSIGNDHYCAKHHEDVEHVGLSCIPRNRGCVAPCPAAESGAYQCSTGGSVPCMVANPTDYCTARCEDVACPTGYECRDYALTPSEPPSGKYCVKTPT